MNVVGTALDRLLLLIDTSPDDPETNMHLGTEATGMTGTTGVVVSLLLQPTSIAMCLASRTPLPHSP